ncbi:MAG: band 7 protein [Nocardioides sp.]|uniref:hypothetical protein n=1 Tax=Nocardioides sp. TaxID=35761 RepID=UPI002624C6FD|nr:hypothetical protein [Nocardioides sp.]MCW2833562.1 band 7 protein [Nocardioides sp.]
MARDPLEQVGGLLTELSQQHALALLAQLTLARALSEGMSAVRETMVSGLGGDERLVQLGLRIVDVRVVAVRAEADVERALPTPTRERVQQEADKAPFERRATAVEHERAIAENELQNQIELARREEQLVTQHTIRMTGAAQAETDTARMAVYADVEQATLVGLARRELAGSLPQIGTLNLTPDLLTTLAERFASGQPQGAGR